MSSDGHRAMTRATRTTASKARAAIAGLVGNPSHIATMRTIEATDAATASGRHQAAWRMSPPEAATKATRTAPPMSEARPFVRASPATPVSSHE